MGIKLTSKNFKGMRYAPVFKKESTPPSTDFQNNASLKLNVNYAKKYSLLNVH